MRVIMASRIRCANSLVSCTPIASFTPHTPVTAPAATIIVAIPKAFAEYRAPLKSSSARTAGASLAIGDAFGLSGGGGMVADRVGRAIGFAAEVLPERRGGGASFTERMTVLDHCFLMSATGTANASVVSASRDTGTHFGIGFRSSWSTMSLNPGSLKPVDRLVSAFNSSPAILHKKEDRRYVEVKINSSWYDDEGHRGQGMEDDEKASFKLKQVPSG